MAGEMAAAAAGTAEDVATAGEAPGSTYTDFGLDPQDAAAVDAASDSLAAAAALDIAKATAAQVQATSAVASPFAAAAAVAASGVFGYQAGNAARAASVAWNGVDPGTWWGDALFDWLNSPDCDEE